MSPNRCRRQNAVACQPWKLQVGEVHAGTGHRGNRPQTQDSRYAKLLFMALSPGFFQTAIVAGVTPFRPRERLTPSLVPKDLLTTGPT